MTRLSMVECYETYRAEVMPPEAGPEQVTECRRAFMAGALAASSAAAMAGQVDRNESIVEVGRCLEDCKLYAAMEREGVVQGDPSEPGSAIIPQGPVTPIEGVRTKFRTSGDFCTAALYLDGILEVDIGRLNRTVLEGPDDEHFLSWRELISKIVNRKIGQILGHEGKVRGVPEPPDYSGEVTE